MTSAADWDFGPETGFAPPKADAVLDLTQLCRLARQFFGVTAATVHAHGAPSAWIDLDPAATPTDWRFALSPPAWPAGAVIEDSVTSGGNLPAGIPSELGIRFLADIAFPGGRLGLFDTRPRGWNGDQRSAARSFSAIAGDMVHLAATAREAMAREAQYRLLAETSTDTIVRGDLDGNRLYISPSVRELLGYEPHELIGRRAMELTHPDDLEDFRRLMQDVRAGRVSPGRTEQRQRHKDGSWIWLEAYVRLTKDPETGEADGYVASVRGIGRRKEIESRLEHLAAHDELTGLPNRKYFRDRLTEAITAMRRGGGTLSLLWIDLDRFKQVNDELGHLAGDIVLRETARRFLAILRAGDMVARLGGDEFIVIQLAADRAAAACIASRLVDVMAAPIEVNGLMVEVGVSIGIACAPDCGSEPDVLLAAADHALYRAKSEGGRTYVFAPADSATG